jgi:hypothetical protein
MDFKLRFFEQENFIEFCYEIQRKTGENSGKGKKWLIQHDYLFDREIL